MGTAALALAALALGLLPIPFLGKYLALGLGILAGGLGLLGFRARTDHGVVRSPRQRLTAAAGAALGAVAVLLAGLKITLTLLALHHLARMIGG